VFLGGEQDSAVGQLASGVGAKLGEAGRSLRAQHQLDHPQTLNGAARVGETAGPCRGDQGLAELPVLAPSGSAPLSASSRPALT
jgi:hypothetical protein